MSITIGEYTYGNPEIKTYNREEKTGNLTIGKFCSIAENVTIMLGGEHEMEKVTTYPFFLYWPEAKGLGDYKTKGDVVIGNDVWIGRGATILSGVWIGDGAVIGAEAVVASDVEPYSIVVGNPARCVKYRFLWSQIGELLKIKWWDWSKEKIIEALPLICSTNIDGFIEKYK